MRFLILALLLCLSSPLPAQDKCQVLWVESNTKFGVFSDLQLLEEARTFFEIETFEFPQSPDFTVILVGGTLPFHRREEATALFDELLTRFPLRLSSYRLNMRFFHPILTKFLDGKTAETPGEKRLFSMFKTWQTYHSPSAQVLVKRAVRFQGMVPPVEQTCWIGWRRLYPRLIRIPTPLRSWAGTIAKITLPSLITASLIAHPEPTASHWAGAALATLLATVIVKRDRSQIVRQELESLQLILLSILGIRGMLRVEIQKAEERSAKALFSFNAKSFHQAQQKILNQPKALLVFLEDRATPKKVQQILEGVSL